MERVFKDIKTFLRNDIWKEYGVSVPEFSTAYDNFKVLDNIYFFKDQYSDIVVLVRFENSSDQFYTGWRYNTTIWRHLSTEDARLFYLDAEIMEKD